VVLQAELVQRYREKVERRPLAANTEQVRLIREATHHEVAALRAELMAKTTELIAASATIVEQGIIRPIASFLYIQYFRRNVVLMCAALGNFC
jgi:hypothetical protein